MRELCEICDKVARELFESCIKVNIVTLCTELLKVEDVKTHVCAIFLRICAKFVLLNVKQEKNRYFFMIVGQFDKIV